MATPTSFVRRGRRFRASAREDVREHATDASDDASRDGSVDDDGGAAGRGRRREPSARLPNARAGLHGRVVVSAGHGDVDALFGGGVPLGACVMCASDGASAHGETLFGLYFLAEGAATAGHRGCWVRRGRLDRAKAMRGFPRRVREVDAGRGGGEKASGTGTRGDARGDADGVGDADGLRIAWQYRRYLKEGRALDDSRVGIGQTVASSEASSASTSTSAVKKRRNLRAPDFCQTFDLTKEEDETALSNADVSYATFRNGSIDDDDPWTRCFEFVRAFVRSLKECEVGRVVVEPETPTDADEWDACVELARALRALMVDTNAVCVMILPLVDAPPHASALIRHLVDCAVDVQPLEGPTSEIESLLPEPHTCVGLIAVRKLQFRGGVVSPLTRMDRVYALQMRRKRLAIKPLQIRPEEEKKGDGASGGACGGGKGGGDLNF